MRILVINCGSSSIKYQVVQTDDGTVLLRGKVDRIEDLPGGHSEALREILKRAASNSPQAVGHRVVHGGQEFTSPQRIDAEVEAAIEACIPLAPLHNPANLAGIRAAREALPDLPQVAVFDTSFHARMPSRARSYALPMKLAEDLGLLRYGFHGTSHACVAGRAAAFLGRPLRELRLVSCHLGNGASVCAIEFGVSVETSMGMTPLEGLVMGTRCGDVDPGIILRLCTELGISETDALLNHQSGLAGVSGLGNDMRDIEQHAAQGHEGARLALKLFAHRVRKYIGAYAAVMGGLDAVLFTGGIGQHSPSMRQRILQRLEFLGVRLDCDANQDARSLEANPVVDIGSESAPARALVVATNEELMIAIETERLAKPASLDIRTSIPIAISGRHVHLDRATMDILFGPGSELEVYKNISQPGQFASKQQVNVVGPRSRIDGVRVLGPLRSKNQIEVSRTDEYKLGVDAPIRDSGKVTGSAPIVLEGPLGRVALAEGLICARRHIHMTPEDAKLLGVSAGEEVEVRVEGGPRDLTFGDVLVRVKSSYVLEMHIDTDEANAAEISSGKEGDLVYHEAAKGACARLRGPIAP